jgi:hypothetical protein
MSFLKENSIYLSRKEVYAGEEPLHWASMGMHGFREIRALVHYRLHLQTLLDIYDQCVTRVFHYKHW